jgi:long-subunit acyl-CoA synthetase (AMP-forming)
MMLGYYKWPQHTQEVLHEGILSTGDLGRFDKDGRLHITGRKKDILVMGDGTKIFLPEYEAELMKTLGHTELAVTLRKDRPVLVFSGKAEKADLEKKLRPVMEKLPRGQQITDILITENPLPRTASGKIKRWELQQKVGAET